MQKLKLILFFFKTIILWLGVFFSGRLLFLALNNEGLPLSELLPVFYKGFLLDLSTACYLTLVPVFLFVWNEFWPSIVKEKFLRRYFLLTLSLVIIIEVSGIYLYREWGNTLNYRAIRYLLYPQDATASIEWKTIILAVLLSSALVGAWIVISRKIIQLGQTTSEKKSSAIIAVALIPLLIIGIRGGFRQIALSESNAYFSENNFLNQAALNKTWYFLRNVMNNIQQEKPYYHYPSFVDPQLPERLYPESKKIKCLTVSKPNIVLVILEGWSADVTGALRGMENSTPCFDSLAKDGLFFTNIYSSGSRTDQGVISLLSGFPALPDLSIVQDVEKSVKLPSLIKDLKNAGYSTSFIYGGESEFCNFKTYFVAQGTGNLVDKYSFTKAERSITWGVPDHTMLQRASQELHSATAPFFSVILTQSSHQPFDSPTGKSMQDADPAEKYKACVHYMDSALNLFMQQARTETWYNNTLFIFVSDHGNRFPLRRDVNDHERYHIPMLFYGNVLDSLYKSRELATIANHHDLPAILLSQLNMDRSAYHFSKDILADSVIPFAYWSTDNTMGWISAEQKIGINLHTTEVFSKEKQSATTEQKNGIGYVQEILKEYERY